MSTTWLTKGLRPAWPGRWLLPMAGAVLVISTAACSQMETRLVSPDPAHPVYELRGRDLVSLNQEAARLCPKGYDVLRQWQHAQRVEAPDLAPVQKYWNRATAVFEEDDNQAQMAVACKTPA